MSVPVNQRSQSKLEACVKAHDLCVYTLQITANDKIFKAEYRAALTDKNYTGLWKGGEADAGKKRDYEPE